MAFKYSLLSAVVVLATLQATLAQSPAPTQDELTKFFKLHPDFLKPGPPGPAGPPGDPGKNGITCSSKQFVIFPNTSSTPDTAAKPVISQTTCLATDSKACVATCPSGTTFVSGGCVCSGNPGATGQVLVSEPISSAKSEDFYTLTTGRGGTKIVANVPNVTATYNFDSQFCICGKSAGSVESVSAGQGGGRKLSQGNPGPGPAPARPEPTPEPQYAIAICCPTET